MTPYVLKQVIYKEFYLYNHQYIDELYQRFLYVFVTFFLHFISYYILV